MTLDYQSRNLVVPRGSVLFNAFEPGTFAGKGYRQIGNVNEFNLSRGTNALEHRSSQIGFSTLDKRLMISDDLTGTMTTDDNQVENVRFWFMSERVDSITIASAAATTETLTVSKGGIYQLGRTNLAPTGLRGVTVTAVTGTGGSPTTYALNTDYVFDEPNGLLTILPGGTIVNETQVIVTYDVEASTMKQIKAQSREVEGELLFISNNPFSDAGGERVWIPRVSLTPNGDLSFMTDPESPSWKQLSFTVSAMKLNNLAIAYRDSFPVTV